MAASTSGEASTSKSVAVSASADEPAASRFSAVSRGAVSDATAGVIASVVLIANIVSFGALMFPGQLSVGIPVAIWAMLIGSCAGGICISLMTSLPPLSTGIDSPTGTVLILLSAMTGGRILAAGGSPQAAVQAVLLVFVAATLACGILLYLLGAFRLGTYFRFVPSSVVGGFLSATGFFLLAGGIRMTTGRQITLDGLVGPWSTPETLKIASAACALIILLSVRHWIKSAFAFPATLVAMWLGSVALLRVFGLNDVEHGWYFHSLGTLSRWSPFTALHTSQLTGPMFVRLLPEILVTAIVALISLITKVSSIETARQASADLDRELRAHGIAALAAAPLGGVAGSLQVGTSRLLEHLGGARMSGVACAVTMGIVGMANFDLPALIPIPLVAGLVFFLAYSFIFDALWRPYQQRAWFDLGLAVTIALVCLQYGYLTGVLAGLVCACMIFTVSCARLGVVRRHATRAQVPSHVVRSPEATTYLRQNGDAIQIYWLSGYIFFGSSEGLFERIQADIGEIAPRQVSYVLLDFDHVSGSDSSAVVSLGKLRSFCARQGISLVYCSLSAKSRKVLERGGFFRGKSPCQVFDDFQTALVWCERQMLAKSGIVIDASRAGFETWLQQRLGPATTAVDLIGYLEQKDIGAAEIIYREGEPADTVDLVAAGDLNIDIATENGGTRRLRRLATHTVVGEMGFFRRSTRSATVSSDGPAVLFSMTRPNLERMRRERPDLAGAFDEFIVRVLANRLDATNREVAALE
jgi:SulP family sulfate permease